MRLGPAPEVEEAPGQFWKDFIRETAPVFRTPTIEQLETFIEPTFRALCDGAAYVDDRLREIFDELQPSLIVEDNVVCFPAIHASGPCRGRGSSPATRWRSRTRASRPCSPGTRPTTAGGWDEFRAAYLRAHAGLHAEFSELCVERGAPPLPEGAFIHASDRLNLYVFPEEIDYVRDRPLGPPGIASTPASAAPRRRSSCRSSSRRARGSSSTSRSGASARRTSTLMRRLIEVLSRSPHRFIVSKGPQHDELDPGRQHVGRGVPAAARDPAARRPRRHPRRQQHDHRVPACRQADGRAAAVLGSDGQRAADRRDRARPPAPAVCVRTRTSCSAAIDRLLADESLQRPARTMATRIRPADGRSTGGRPDRAGRARRRRALTAALRPS